MEQYVINAKTRKETGKRISKQLRAEGRIPAIAYNEKGQSTMLDIDAAEFSKIWRTITPTTPSCYTYWWLYDVRGCNMQRNRSDAYYRPRTTQ